MIKQTFIYIVYSFQVKSWDYSKEFQNYVGNYFSNIYYFIHYNKSLKIPNGAGATRIRKLKIPKGAGATRMRKSKKNR